MVEATGSGRTMNISSNGLAFTTDETFNIGAYIELSICWPVLLNDNCLLKLAVQGSVVRSNGQFTAVSLHRHEFRTQAQGRFRRSDPEHV